MNHWSEYPFVRILFAYLGGIAVGLFTPLHVPVWLLLLLMLITLLSHFKLKNNTILLYRHAAMIGLPFHLAVFALGAVHTSFSIDFHQPRHYIHQLDTAGYFLAKVEEPPIEKERSIKVPASVIAYIENGIVRPSNGKTILYLSKDSLPASIAYGNILLIKNRLKPVAPPANPGQFNYQKYLWYKEIYATAFLKPEEWQLLSITSAHPLFTLTYKLRDLSVQAIQAHISSSREAGVVEALVIGFKDHMSPETLQSYSAAGVVHVLAVSGLHVAILFALLHQLLFFLNKKKHGKMLQAVIIIVVIWLFSMVTGLSGSVVRAATMFTFITIGKNMKRPVSLFNLLACSALFILWANPLLLMDVGFQLSYLAVLGIGTLNRYIDAWLPRENKLIDYLWKMVAMSLAAQIATLPLTTFYFHQFPTYFLLANIVVIPAAGVLLHLGILLIAIQMIPPLATATGTVIEWITFFMNEFIMNVQQLPGSVIQLPAINALQLLLLGCITIAVSRYFISVDIKWMYALLVSAVMITAMHIHDVCRKYQDKTITLYAFKGASALEFRSGNTVQFFNHGGTLSKQDSLYLQQQWMLNHVQAAIPNRTAKNLGKATSSDTTDYSVFQFGRFRMAVLHGPVVWAQIHQKTNVDVLVISGNPSMQLSEAVKKLHPGTVVFDPTNSRYRINQWKEEAKQLGLQTHNVMEEGAFIRRL